MLASGRYPDKSGFCNGCTSNLNSRMVKSNFVLKFNYAVHGLPA